MRLEERFAMVVVVQAGGDALVVRHNHKPCK